MKYLPFIYLSMVLAACSPAARPAPTSPPMEPTAAMEPTTMLDFAGVTEAPTQEPIAMSASEGAAMATSAPAATAAAGGNPVAPPQSMVIKDAQFDLQVGDVNRVVVRLTQLAADAGGYLIDSQVFSENGQASALVRVAVPAARFERAVNDIRAEALVVLREQLSGQDVSAEYTDLQSRLTNLEATAARVRELLADAKTVEESLRISGELSQLEGQIERIKGQMRYFEGRAAFSTITVSLVAPPITPTITPTPTQTPTPTPTATPVPWNPGATAAEASGTLTSMTQQLVDAAIWLGIVGGPFLLVGGVLLFGARRVFRRR